MIEYGNRRVSIIIPVYDRKEELINCIDSIRCQDYSDVEVIVIDDCSFEPYCTVMSEIYHSNIIFINNSYHVGPSFARNQGIRVCTGSYILFLDSDTEFISKSTISNMVNALDSNDDYGSVGGEIVARDNDCKYSYGKMVGFDGYTRPVIASADSFSPVFCDYLATCNCMVRKKIIYDIGGFDPYWEFGGEDVDIGFKIQKKGFKNVVMYNVSVLHHRSRSGRLVEEQYFYQRARVRFLFKNCNYIRIIMVAIIDTIKIIRYYLILPLKITIKIFSREKILHADISGGFLIIKAYAWNACNYFQTVNSRHANFLKCEFDNYTTRKIDETIKCVTST